MNVINNSQPFYKKKSVIISTVIGLVLVILLGSFIGSSNGLNRSQQDVDEATGSVQTALQNRADLIPNLVNAIKGSQAQESAVYGKIAEARTQYNQAKSNYQNANSQDQKTTAMEGQERALNVMVSAINENYPNLKSGDQVSTLMSQIEGADNRVTYQRLKYNKAVRAYNDKVVSFPSSIVAGMTNHQKLKYFQADSAAQSNPVVDFSK
ncbi:LemA family protein [Convivina intestini]|uniref:LemA protein n=1 Tax=Convivina intestini TaxID=1505726 RepID=A0A2U1DBD4_9LACO|nr:LemA family protein [Convivina intestini]PVY85005.1 LemA protein [Convivina intestini]CAH1853376.1 Protein LemA [Convivina intestini]SDB89446.1 LemA protein [Leuconostocaceae bacterium R-53105]